MNETKINDVIEAAEKLVDYFAYHNKNTTKAQDEKIMNLADALLKFKEAQMEKRKMSEVCYVVTDLRDVYRTEYWVEEGRKAEMELYDRIVDVSDCGHDEAAEMAAWAMEAPIGDNWTNEEIGVDVRIEEE